MTFRVARAETGVARVASGPVRRKMTLSEALKWAWGDELPKEPAIERPAGFGSLGAWGAIARFGELNSVIDRQPNRYGCIPFDQADFPHPDAVRIAEAVKDLDDLVVDLPDGWHPMPEIAAIDVGLAGLALADTLRKVTVTTEAGEIRFKVSPGVIIVRHAILGLVPNWRLDEIPVIRHVVGANGREKWFVKRETRSIAGRNPDGTDRVVTENVEVDGWSTSKQRPVHGAYRKPYLDPDPVPVMVARAEYEIFCAAMATLAADLADRLETISIVADDWPACPWIDGETRLPSAGRILADLRQVE